MAAEPALALVIRGSDWSETSRIATLWTREFGKVRALAKGGRRLRSSFETAFDLLTVCRVMVIRKGHGGLDLLTEAQVAERFPRLRDDLPALYAGYYVAELLSDGTGDGDPHPPLFDAAVDTLRALAGGPNPSPSPSLKWGGGQNQAFVTALPPPPRSGEGAGGRGCFGPSALLSAFELVWLRELGYSPRLDACASCGAAVEPPPGGATAFSPTAGGVLCPRCRPAAADRRPLSAAGLAALRALDAGGIAGAALPQDAAGEVRRLLGQTVSAVLGRRPRLLQYVDPG